MPCDTFWEPTGVLLRCSGQNLGADLLGASERIAAHRRLESIRYLILDLSAVEDHEFDAGAVEALAMICSTTKANNPDFRIILISPKQHLAFIADPKMVHLFGGRHHCNAFDHLDNARDWLAGSSRQ